MPNGYLADPEEKYGRIYNPFLFPFEEIAEIPCLILLGEPGTGKSTVLEEQHEFVEEQVRNTVDQALRFDLGAYQSDTLLHQSLFGCREFQDWLHGTHHLHLFLDSLDECLLQIQVVARLLAETLRQYSRSLNRLSLRIACRTAEWPLSFETKLMQLWGEANVQGFELAPLREKDVALAAQDCQIDAAVFLKEVDRADAVPFAIKPVTLNFLLNLYARSGGFPNRKLDLYEQGCRRLCEVSRKRRDAKLFGDLDADQRLTVASRIAAVTIFANRHAIWVDIDDGNVPKTDVTRRDLCGAHEDDLSITEKVIEETLDTGLFSGRGKQRLGWAHQTYAEFLAARYLVHHNFSLEDILHLIVHPDDAEGYIVPQLHETAAWLASMRSDVFQILMTREPEVLLRSDVATADVADRERLVAALLERFEREEFLDSQRDLRRNYYKLKHPSLAEQLRPYICNKHLGWLVRRVAIDLAEACEIRELQEDIAAVALDQSDEYWTRVNAARAVVRIGDDVTKARLKPLAMEHAGDDPYGQLKGYGLSAVWPVHLSVEELTSILKPPMSNFFGSYEQFLSGSFLEQLSMEEIPVALRWVAQQPENAYRQDTTLKRLTDTIMLHAWSHIDTPDIADAFAYAALARLRIHMDIVSTANSPRDIFSGSPDDFLQVISNDHERRRKVLAAVVPLCDNPEHDAVCIVRTGTPLALPDDLAWLIGWFESSIDQAAQRVLHELIKWVFTRHNPDHLEIAYAASQRNADLATLFNPVFRAVILNSPEAERQKQEYQKELRWQQERQQVHLVDPPPAQRIARLLEQFEAGNVAAWWRLNMEVTLKPDSEYYGNEFETDLTSQPGWIAADGETRARITTAAHTYLTAADPEDEKWYGTHDIYRPALAGYRAFALLLREDRSLLLALPAEIWKRWASIIVTFPTKSGIGDERPHQELVQLLYQNAPDKAMMFLLSEIDYQNRKQEYISGLEKFDLCWNDYIAKVLLTKAQDATLNPGCMRSLLAHLLKHEYVAARTYAESLITTSVPEDASTQTRALNAAHVLLEHTEDAAWSTIWPVMQQNAAFGREIMETFVYGDTTASEVFANRLTEREIADLYIWMVQQYPPAEDPPEATSRGMSPAIAVTRRVSIGWWRDKLRRQLQQRGKPAAVAELQRLVQTFPAIKELKWLLPEARTQALRQTWNPPTPEAIINLAVEPLDRATLRQLLNSHFSESELRDLCFDLELDYEQLPGDRKGDKARELIMYCERHGRIDELVTMCRKLRPHALI
jgi:predicted NACHT family NTPase